MSAADQAFANARFQQPKQRTNISDFLQVRIRAEETESKWPPIISSWIDSANDSATFDNITQHTPRSILSSLASFYGSTDDDLVDNGRFGTRLSWLRA